MSDSINPNIPTAPPVTAKPVQAQTPSRVPQTTYAPEPPPVQSAAAKINPYLSTAPDLSWDSPLSPNGQYNRMRDFMVYAQRAGIQIDENEEYAKLNLAQYFGPRTGVSTAEAYKNIDSVVQSYYGMMVPPRKAWQSVVDEGRAATQSVKASHLAFDLMKQAVSTAGGSEQFQEKMDEYIKLLKSIKTYDNANQPLWAKALGAGAAFVPSVGVTLWHGLLGALGGATVAAPGVGFKVGQAYEGFRLAAGSIYGDVLTTMVPNPNGTERTLYDTIMQDVPEQERSAALKSLNQIAVGMASVGGLGSSAIELVQMNTLLKGSKLLSEAVIKGSGNWLKDLFNTKALSNRVLRFLAVQGMNVTENTVQELVQENIEWGTAEIIKAVWSSPNISQVPRTELEQWTAMMKEVAAQASMGSFVLGLPGAIGQSRKIKMVTDRFRDAENAKIVDTTKIEALPIEVKQEEKEVMADEFENGNAEPLNVWVDETGKYRPADRRAQVGLQVLEEQGVEATSINVVEKPENIDLALDDEQELDYDAEAPDEAFAPLPAEGAPMETAAVPAAPTMQGPAQAIIQNTAQEQKKMKVKDQWRQAKLESRLGEEWRRQLGEAAGTVSKITQSTLNSTEKIAQKIAEYMGLDYDTFLDTAFQPQAFIYDPQLAQDNRGEVRFQGGKAQIVFGPASDATTVLHEFAHVTRQHLREDHRAALEAHYGAKFWAGKGRPSVLSRQAEERFAEDFEIYLREGKAPTAELKGVFQRLAKLFRDIYQLVGRTLAPEVRRVFNEMLGMDPSLAEAQMDLDITKMDFAESLAAARERVAREAAAVSAMLNKKYGPEIDKIQKEDNAVFAQKKKDWAEGLGAVLIGKGNYAVDVISMALKNDVEGLAKFRKDHGLNPTGGNPVHIVHKLFSKLTAEAHGMDLTDFKSPEAIKVLGERLAAEVGWAIDNAKKDAIGWYDVTLKKAMKVYAEYFPELADDLGAQMIFKSALAITSQGNDVFSNSAAALDAYKFFRENGKYPDIGYGESAPAIKGNFALMNDLIDLYDGDWEAFNKFMTDYFKVSEMEFLGYKTSGENKDALLPGSMVLGPKIGAGFYSNLFGNYLTLTMDLWFTRTASRHMGDAGDVTSEKTKAQNRQEIKDWLAKITPEEIALYMKGVTALSTFKGTKKVLVKNEETGKKELAFDTITKGQLIYEFEGEYTPEKLLASEELLDQWMEETRLGVNYGGTKYTKYGHKDAYAQVKDEKRAEIKKNAEYATETRATPKGGTEREFFRDAVAKGIDILSSSGYSGITPADFQAVLWFLEKDFYSALGAADKKAESADYFDAAKENTQDEQKHTRRSANQARGVQPGSTPVSQKYERGNRQGVAKGDERIAPPTSGRYQEGSSGPYRRTAVTGALHVFVTGEKVAPVAAYVPEKMFSIFSEKAFVHITDDHIIDADGSIPHTVFEYEGQAAAEAFHNAMIAYEKSMGDLSVMVQIKPVEQLLASYRLFMTEDGLAGFALNRETGDLTSLFKAKGGPDGFANMALPLGIQVGGRRLDCYDTVLPYIYGQFGFVDVARDKFNADYLEEKNKGKWPYEKLKQWHPEGKPDLVYMALGANVAENGWLQYQNYKDIRAGRMDKRGTYGGKIRRKKQDDGSTQYETYGLKRSEYLTPGDWEAGVAAQDEKIDEVVSFGQSARRVAEFTAPLEPQVARENKMRWFGDSKITDDRGEPLEVYHSSSVSIDEFYASMTNPSSSAGQGIYFAESPDDANLYTDEKNPDLAAKIDSAQTDLIDAMVTYPEEFTDEPVIMDMYKDWEDTDTLPTEGEFEFWIQKNAEHVSLVMAKDKVLGGRNVHPVILRMERPFDEENTIFDPDEDPEVGGPFTTFMTAVIDAGYSDEVLAAIHSDITDYGGPISGIEMKQIIESTLYDYANTEVLDLTGEVSPREGFRIIVQAAGYDGMIQHMSNYTWGQWHYSNRHFVVFNGKQIKSSYNRGTYDENDPVIFNQTHTHEELVRRAVRDGRPVADSVLHDYQDRSWARKEIKFRAALKNEFDWLYEYAKVAESVADLKKRVGEELPPEYIQDNVKNDAMFERVFRMANAPDREKANELWVDSVSSTQNVRALFSDLHKGNYEDLKGIGIHPRALAAIRKGTIRTPAEADVLLSLIQRRPEVYRKALAIATKDEEALSAIGYEHETAILEAFGRTEASPSTRMSVAAEVNDPELRRLALTGKATGAELRALSASYKKKNDKLELEAAKLTGELTKKDATVAKKQGIIEKLKNQEIERKANIQKQRDVQKLLKYRLELGQRITKKIPKSVDYSARAIINDLASGVDPKNRSAAYIEKRNMAIEMLNADPALKAALKPSELKALAAKPLNEWTTEELEDMAHKVSVLINIGKRIKADRDGLRKKEIQQATSGGILDVMKGKDTEDILAIGSEEAQKIREGGNVAKSLDGKIATGTLRPPRVIRKLFGEDSEMYKWFITNVNLATDESIRQTQSRRKTVEDMRKKLGIKMISLTNRHTVEGKTYNVDQIMHIYLGMKNKKSAAAIEFGNKLTQSQIGQFIAKLTQNEKEYADFLLKEFDANYERLRRAYINYANEDMGKEENYFPMLRLGIHSDTIEADLADQMLARNAWAAAYADRGFTIRRIDISDEHQSPIRLGAMSVWSDQVDKQEHFIASGQLVKDLHAIRRNTQLSAAITQSHGDKYNKWLEKYVNDFASPHIYKALDDTSRLFQKLRGNYALGALAWNMLTVGKQIPALTLFLSRVGPLKLLAGAGEFLVNPKKAMAFVNEKDPQMIERSMERYLAELKARQGSVTKKASYIAMKVAEAGMWPMQQLDAALTTMGWLAVYRDHIARGFSEEHSVQAAQMAALETQQTARAKDLANIYRSNEVMNWFTMFTNQTNQLWNMLYGDLPAALKERQIKKVVGILAGVMINSLAMVYATGWRPPEDDGEPKEELYYQMIAQLIGLAPLIGSTVSSAMGRYGYDGVSPFAIAEGVGEFTGYLFEEDKDAQATWKAIGALAEEVGMGVGVPTIAGKRVGKMFGQFNEDDYLDGVLAILGPLFKEKIND